MRFIFLNLSVLVHWILLQHSSNLVKNFFTHSNSHKPVFLSLGHASHENDELLWNSKRNNSFNQELGMKNTVGNFNKSVASLSTEQIVKYGNALPSYPAEAAERGWQGTVVLSLKLGAEGEVCEVKLLESSGFQILDMAAVEASRYWRFKGFSPHGALVAPIRFSVES